MDITFTFRTLYNYVEKSVLSVKNINLPRKVKYKPRKGPKPPRKEHAWLEGRKYLDFTELLRDYPETPAVEMDTVEGTVGGKVLLTMLFRNSRCMLAFLLPSKKQIHGEFNYYRFPSSPKSNTNLILICTVKHMSPYIVSF